MFIRPSKIRRSLSGFVVSFVSHDERSLCSLHLSCRTEQWFGHGFNKTALTHRIIADCAYFGKLDKPCQFDDNFDVGQQYVCYCEGDACNVTAITYC